MDLVLWRHADAEEGSDDARRRLTRKGLKQAAQMASWLDARLPKSARIIVSPAERAQQTAKALSREAATSAEVGTEAQPRDILKAAGWPHGTGTVVVVGHQPTLGAAAALALTGKAASWRMKKGAVWWLSSGAGEGGGPLVLAVMTPDLI
jgi:phosphohistidine phosphatase